MGVISKFACRFGGPAAVWRHISPQKAGTIQGNLMPRQRLRYQHDLRWTRPVLNCADGFVVGRVRETCPTPSDGRPYNQLQPDLM